MMSDLPDDCIRKILLRMTDHKDIVNTGATEVRLFLHIRTAGCTKGRRRLAFHQMPSFR